MPLRREPALAGFELPAGAFAQLEGQQTLWHQTRATLKERVSRSHISGDGSAELLSFAEREAHEAELLASRLERYASNNAVPREWRRE